MSAPSKLELKDAIKKAVRKAVEDLFREYPERFYYCSLITDGQGDAPVLTAWSEEALERELRDEGFPDEVRSEIKWSYADSPFFAYGEEYFDEVNKLFQARPRLDENVSDNDWGNELQLRLMAMESAMKELDDEGLFGHGRRRCAIVINVEVMPPDYGNTERALRLNPREALIEWIEEASEE